MFVKMNRNVFCEEKKLSYFISLILIVWSCAFQVSSLLMQHFCNTETVGRQGSRVETAHCYSLYTRASSILARTTHIPHMSLAISVKLTVSGAQVVE